MYMIIQLPYGLKELQVLNRKDSLAFQIASATYYLKYTRLQRMGALCRLKFA